MPSNRPRGTGVNFFTFGTFMMIYIRGMHPDWPYDFVDEAELRSVGMLFRELEPVSDEKFEQTIEQFLRMGRTKKTPLLERLAVAWAKGNVTGWPQHRPDEKDLRQALQVLQKATMATDAQVEAAVASVLHDNPDEGAMF